jgi:PAS domain S-box-containing protein
MTETSYFRLQNQTAGFHHGLLGMLLFSRTSGARTPASRGCWALCRLQPTAGIINLCALALLTIFAIPLCALSRSAPEEQPREKNVLVLFSAVQYSLSFLDLIEPSMRARVPGPITFYDAYLEDPQVEEKSYRESVSETLRRRYAQVKLDVVIVCNPAALHFAVEYRDKIFPGVPIVFVGVGAGDLEKQKIWPGVTGVASPWGFRETIDLMLRLQPDTNTVAVVAGETRWDKQFLAVAHSELLRHQDKVREVDLSGPPNHQLFERVAALPPHTVALFQVFPQFMNQPEFGTWDLVAAVAQRLPTYSVFPRLCAEGCIGGAYEDATKEDLWAAEIAARLLLGERPDNIPVAYATDLQIRVDWRALRRWQIPESALPSGSVVLNREPTLWERYRKYVVAAIAVIAVQLLLILGLLWQRVKRRKIEASLVESLRFEGLLSDLSTTFINLPEDQVNANIEKNLGRIAEFFNIERITFHEFSAKKKTELIATFPWTAKGINPSPSVVEARQFPHWTNRLLRGEVVLASALPGLHEEEASPEKEYLRQHGAMSAALVPLTAGGEALGFISFVSTKRQVPWADDVIKQMRALAEIFSNALRRKRADEVLRESEGRFRLVADNAPALIWMAGTDKLYTFFNKGWLDFTGRSMEQELGEGWASGVHPDDLERCLGIYSRAFDAQADFEMEYRLQRFDGEYRWIVDYGAPRFESNGTFRGYIGSCIDITDRKLSETSLRELSGRLIHAQEEERTRIARELHDDLSQRMALLSISLEQFEQGIPDLSSEARQQLHDIAEVATEVSSSVHDLSHQLHPPKLDILGLVVSLQGLCREFSGQHKLQVQFDHSDVPIQIPKDVTLCLFRIVQEALRNVVKHSGAAEAKVELSSHDDGIDLCISDSGVGFDPESVKGESGLGLVSIRERLRLVGGHLVVESEPSHGTRIRVRVPLRISNAGVTSEKKTHTKQGHERSPL